MGKFWEGPHAYLFRSEDGRVITAVPQGGDLCLIGTTDIVYRGRPENVAVDESEIRYLLEAVNRFVAVPLRPAHVRSSFSGVRPIHEANPHACAVAQDRVFLRDGADGEPPLLSVIGGKITTFRRLAEQAIDALRCAFAKVGKPWTAATPLPGGDIPHADFQLFLNGLRRESPWLPADLAGDYAHNYASRARALLRDANNIGGLGRHFVGLLYQKEAEFLRQAEWASTASDILERRTKHGLKLTEDQRNRFTEWIGAA